MNIKNIAVAGIAGGIILLIALFVFGKIAGVIAPFDVTTLGGMRAVNDPVMSLFFFYPFVVSFAAAILFDVMKDSLKGTAVNKGLTFGLILFMLETIPSMVVIFTTMTYPPGFYLSSFLDGIIGFPVIGILFVKIWKI
ncbi:MAG: hypothetical protein STSR0009_29510 [Methanoregula sp.]